MIIKMKQIYNYHTHTYRCGHASGSDEDYVLAAIEAGYKVLGFSDHAPYRDFPNKISHMNRDEFPGYLESIRQLKEKYKDTIEIKLGIESEYYPYLIEEKKELRKSLDYMSLGQHFINPDGTGSFFKNNSDEEILIYGKSVCEALDSGMYDYLCHPDVFMNRQEVFNKTCEKVARMIMEKAAETKTPVEINIHGILRGIHDFPEGPRYYYPFREFWQIAAGYPIKVFFGVDAHKPEQLLDKETLDKAVEVVSDLGFDFIREPFIR